jgi:hypothetical protein
MCCQRTGHRAGVGIAAITSCHLSYFGNFF